MKISVWYVKRRHLVYLFCFVCLYWLLFFCAVDCALRSFVLLWFLILCDCCYFLDLSLLVITGSRTKKEEEESIENCINSGITSVSE
jgi:hypothetical protein